MITIIDYGVGNLFSLNSSLKSLGVETLVTDKAEDIMKSEKLLLPGVGAFEDAIGKLRASGLDKCIIEKAKSGTPLLGICLGMQLLFERSFEFGEHTGLGLIKGDVSPIDVSGNKNLKIPHIGWNALSFPKNKERCRIFKTLNENDFVYFVHSYHGTNCDESTCATTEYGITVTAAVCDKNVYGTQFHPEKSGKVGLKILEEFCKL